MGGVTEDVLRVGAIADLSGVQSTVVIRIIYAQTAYWDMVNANGGIAGKQLEIASGELDKTKGEVVFLNKAKGGLEELLFRKTAEIRKLKGDLRKLHASRDKPDPPAGRKGGAPSREPGEPPPATARAD